MNLFSQWVICQDLILLCELLKSYIVNLNNRLMSEKSKELGDAANKLKNGLEKIDDTREKVPFNIFTSNCVAILNTIVFCFLSK